MWSLRARMMFGITVAAELLLVGLFARVEPFVWMILLTLPLLSWFLDYEARRTQGHISALLDQVALNSGMVKLAPGQRTNAPVDSEKTSNEPGQQPKLKAS
jgi:hypothetical protein